MLCRASQLGQWTVRPTRWPRWRGRWGRRPANRRNNRQRPDKQAEAEEAERASILFVRNGGGDGGAQKPDPREDGTVGEVEEVGQGDQSTWIHRHIQRPQAGNRLEVPVRHTSKENSTFAPTPRTDRAWLRHRPHVGIEAQGGSTSIVRSLTDRMALPRSGFQVGPGAGENLVAPTPGPPRVRIT